MGHWVRRFYGLLSDYQIEALFDIVKSNGVHETLSHGHGLSFDWQGQIISKLIRHESFLRLSGQPGFLCRPMANALLILLTIGKRRFRYLHEQ